MSIFIVVSLQRFEREFNVFNFQDVYDEIFVSKTSVVIKMEKFAYKSCYLAIEAIVYIARQTNPQIKTHHNYDQPQCHWT